MKVEIYSKPQCPYCDMAKKLAEQKGYELIYKMLDEDFDRETLMETFPGARTFPQRDTLTQLVMLGSIAD